MLTKYNTNELFFIAFLNITDMPTIKYYIQNPMKIYGYDSKGEKFNYQNVTDVYNRIKNKYFVSYKSSMLITLLFYIRIFSK